MFIQTEDTPNPLAMKFCPGRPLGDYQGKTYSKDNTNLDTDPLAQALLSIMGVSRVFFAQDFITVTRDESSEWLFLKPQILGVIMDYFMAQATAPHLSSPSSTPEASGETLLPSDGSYDDSPIAQEIRELLETRVKPAVAEHGGTIVFDSFKDGIVYLHFKGACSGCPSADLTLKMGVEKMLMHYIPEITEVRAL